MVQRCSNRRPYFSPLPSWKGSSMNLGNRHSLKLIVLATAAVLVVGCSDAKQRNESSQNLKHLTRAVLQYQSDNQKWPDKISDVASVVGQSDDMGTIGNGKAYDALIRNPLTGDDPGYGYAKPADEPESYSNTVVVFQLRDGKRDDALPAAYLDGSVH